LTRVRGISLTQENEVWLGYVGHVKQKFRPM